MVACKFTVADAASFAGLSRAFECMTQFQERAAAQRRRRLARALVEDASVGGGDDEGCTLEDRLEREAARLGVRLRDGWRSANAGVARKVAEQLAARVTGFWF